ncbi:hypothetical protein [Pseudonocardia sp. McavD-2-B]|nr:hypothetical protein [Pseudonocardia sp. McavD-2-B]MCO7195397.1 hypothetical protein [Pseudonocardia sp. McavD-2-B]
MAARWPDDPPAWTFRGGCTCWRHVLWRSLTDWRGHWAALAPLRHRGRR